MVKEIAVRIDYGKLQEGEIFRGEAKLRPGKIGLQV